MYTVALPPLNVLTCTDGGEYRAAEAHARAKRAQVELAAQWAHQWPELCVVSCHAGWVDTPGWVDGSGVASDPLGTLYRHHTGKMQPLRTRTQGAAGLCWLLCAPIARRTDVRPGGRAPCDSLESGRFYLDAAVQPTHMAGVAFTEGSATKPSAEHLSALLELLERNSQLATDAHFGSYAGLSAGTFAS